MWLIGIIGFRQVSLKALAKLTPCHKQGSNPGPTVTATKSMFGIWNLEFGICLGIKNWKLEIAKPASFKTFLNTIGRFF